ncbi:MAG TPA: AmpG family muropeptide MFS transporter [Magnetospirillum sp.]|nr:AmpG family muropeptide MFS transporter [Magnetospirillum sp.]
MAQARAAFAAYLDRRVLMVLVLGFASGLPLLLTFSTLSAWLKGAGISRTAIGVFALVGTPYAFKFLWSPLIDRLPLPVLTRVLGRRRSWGLVIQIMLMVATLALGATDPSHDLVRMAQLAVLVAFLSASQDIVIDAYRVEVLDSENQGPGAGAALAGYRTGMLMAGAGALYLAESFGWFVAYAAMAALLIPGMLIFLLGPEPTVKVSAATAERERRAAEYLTARPHLRGPLAQVAAWLHGALVCPFADFMNRQGWLVVLIFVVGYKLGEAMAGAMANTLYVELKFTLEEIAWVSKVFGFGATVLGSMIGGALVVRMGVMRALLLFGILQSAGNLFYALQAVSGHDIRVLALCVAAENLTAGMAGAALVAYISGFCNAAYTATQYALLSSLTAVGRTMFASTSGLLADTLGWVDFFLLTTVVTVPALLLLIWMMRKLPMEPAGQQA